jgi:hypothetical protein
VLPVVRAVVVAPHLQADLQRLLEALEALGDRWVRHAEPAVLALVPGGADAELGAATGEDVEGGDDLGQQAGMAVRDTGDEQPEVHAPGLAGEEPEAGVALEHRLGGRGHLLHLEPVVHHGERGGAALLGDAGRLGERRRDRRRAAGEAEVHEMDTELHLASCQFAQGPTPPMRSAVM